MARHLAITTMYINLHSFFLYLPDRIGPVTSKKEKKKKSQVSKAIPLIKQKNLYR